MEKTFNGHFKYKYSQQVSDELTACSLSKIMREKRADELISLFKYEESYKNYFDEIVKSCEDEYRKNIKVLIEKNQISIIILVGSILSKMTYLKPMKII